MTTTGNPSRPYHSLKAALENPALEAGDTVWLAAGTHIISEETTIACDSLTIKPQIGQTAIIEIQGNSIAVPHQTYINIDGDNVRFRDVTIRGAPTRRACEGQAEEDYPDSGWIRVRGRAPTDGTFAACTLIDLITVTCFDTAADTPAQVLYKDSTVLNYGFLNAGTGEGDGEAAYLQNCSEQGDKILENTIIGPGYGVVVQAYSQNSAAVNHMVFQNLILADDLSGARRLYIYTIHGADDVAVNGCIFWGARPTIGEFNAENGACVVTDNYIVKATEKLLRVGDWYDHDVENNSVINIGTGEGPLVIYDPRNAVGTRIWNNNAFVHPGSDLPFRVQPTLSPALPFAIWQSQTGFDADSSYDTSLPVANVTYVKPCSVLPRVAHIAVYNWQLLDTVDVDVSGTVMRAGSSYRIYNAYDPESDYDDFTYDGGGSITVSLINRTVAIPRGDDTPLATLDKRFGAWFVEILS